MVRVQVVKTFNDTGKLKAILNVHLENFMAINGCRLFENENGKFVSMPRQQYAASDGTVKYRDIISVENRELKDTIEKCAISEYENVLNNNETESEEIEKEISEDEIVPWEK